MANPKGVKSYGHESKDGTGKFHPDAISSGIPDVSRQGGSPPKVSNKFSGSRSVIPSGVKRGDGTETRKGTEPSTKMSQKSNAKRDPTNSRAPSGIVRSATGTTVPKSVK